MGWKVIGEKGEKVACKEQVARYKSKDSGASFDSVYKCVCMCVCCMYVSYGHVHLCMWMISLAFLDCSLTDVFKIGSH